MQASRLCGFSLAALARMSWHTLRRSSLVPRSADLETAHEVQRDGVCW